VPLLDLTWDAGSTHRDGSITTAEPGVHRPIAHPGILQAQADLEFMKAKIKAGEKPWKSGWQTWAGSYPPVAELSLNRDFAEFFAELYASEAPIIPLGSSVLH
jgi:hypothetical protein